LALRARRQGLSSSARVATPGLWIFAVANSFFNLFSCHQELMVLFLSRQIKRLKDLWFKLLFYGDFLNAPTSCSVKCL
jgi:hypothetical protein